VAPARNDGLAARPLGPIHQTILGLIVETPRHGYLIKKLLCEGNGRDFGINDGLLYPALARLEREGLIRKEVVHQEKSPSKHTYHATGKGEEAFFRWLMESAGEEDPFRYDFYLRFGFLVKATFFKHLDPRAVREKVERQIADAREKIRDFRRVREKMAGSEADWYRLKIMDFGVGYQALKLEWLEQFAHEIDERIGMPSAPRPRARKAGAGG